MRPSHPDARRESSGGAGCGPGKPPRPALWQPLAHSSRGEPVFPADRPQARSHRTSTPPACGKTPVCMGKTRPPRGKRPPLRIFDQSQPGPDRCASASRPSAHGHRQDPSCQHFARARRHPSRPHSAQAAKFHTHFARVTPRRNHTSEAALQSGRPQTSRQPPGPFPRRLSVSQVPRWPPALDRSRAAQKTQAPDIAVRINRYCRPG